MKIENVWRNDCTSTYEIDIDIKSNDLSLCQPHIEYFKGFENYDHFEIQEMKDRLVLSIYFEQ